MTTQFQPLFTVAVAHGYYRGDCRDVAFLLPGDAGALLARGRLLAREREGRLHVLYEADEAGAPRVSLAGQTLRLGLRLRNPHFSNISELDPEFAGTCLLYRNRANPAALEAPRPCRMVGAVFAHELADAARPVTVTLKDADGKSIAAETIAIDADRTAVTCDLARQAPGWYVIEEQYPAQSRTAECYLDPELASRGVYGVLEVTIDGAFYAAPPEFRLAFAARRETLKYYVVGRNFSQADLSQLLVADAGFGEDQRPQIAFARIDAAAFGEDDIDPGLLTDPGSKVVLFKSQAAVTRQEQARKKIQLTRNGEVLIPHLPQPGPEQTSAALIVSLSKP